MLWIQYINHFVLLKTSKTKWLIVALALPIGFLLIVKLFSVILGKDFGAKDVIISVAGITAVVAITYLIDLFRRKFIRKLPAGDT